MFSILWSDHNKILIYRQFEDFKKLNRELKRKFPIEAGLFKKSEKILPKFKDVPLFRKNRSTNRFIERLHLLEKYSHELLRADGKISKCDLVVNFFTPRNNDLNPNFPENSLMIMSSEVKEQKEQQKKLPSSPVTHPIVSQKYVCMEDYETKDTKNRPFKVKQHQTLEVLIKENSGWWLVENEEKHLAWFPAPYLKESESCEGLDYGMDPDDEGILYYASKAYEAMNSDEISITVGVLVEIIEKANNGWWLIRYNGRAGYVPAMYLKPYRTYQQIQTMVSEGKSTSTPNLFKASSSLTLNTNTDGEKTSEEQSESKSGDNIWKTPLKLDRRKSRSLYRLPSNMILSVPMDLLSKKDITSKTVLRGSTRSLNKECNVKPAKKTEGDPGNSIDQPDHAQNTYKPRLVASGDGTTVISTQTSKCTPSKPFIPQRPGTHEILNRCTTVTKKALQRQEEINQPIK
ncbi:hypothetical protein GDO86_017565 [Hymenochirus boettgeri]|uniref:NADPH oxidase organizer 1 n=1 Tax=Hymenochirus boettgeri TaxID=247094 RepID=A0A8T2IQW6_9PIPI|nr:hypothetical protein GDO86_017565 [Hymenochirus boettgeri]